jgi:hypothetical protein
MVLDSPRIQKVAVWLGLLVVLRETVSRIRHSRLLARTTRLCPLFLSTDLGLTHTVANVVGGVAVGKRGKHANYSYLGIAPSVGACRDQQHLFVCTAHLDDRNHQTADTFADTSANQNTIGWFG